MLGGELVRGDVAPLGGSRDFTIHAPDLMLLMRAARGEDVDGDGLAGRLVLPRGDEDR